MNFAANLTMLFTEYNFLDRFEKAYKNNFKAVEYLFPYDYNPQELKNLLNDYKNDGKKIAGYAATSKSTTVLNYCGIGNDIIDYICDTTDEKINKYSPGMHIPIVPVNHFRNNMPDIAYLFAWNHKEEIFNKEKEFTNKNKKWISHIDL